MVIALFIVAFAMVGGGLAALIQGLPYIMVERGWAMVIAGTVAASGGAILAGIAVAALRVGRIYDELAALQDRLARLDGPMLRPGLAKEDVEPNSSDFAPDVSSQALPATELGSRAASIAPGGSALASERAGAQAPEVRPEPQNSGKASQGSSSQTRETEATKPGPSEEATVIGTYSSGGNSYVMFSDGSIQADTPNGHYRFKSLDELKEFIAAGGETEGAARG
jgi:hypothetical protein